MNAPLVKSVFNFAVQISCSKPEFKELSCSDGYSQGSICEIENNRFKQCDCVVDRNTTDFYVHPECAWQDAIKIEVDPNDDISSFLTQIFKIYGIDGNDFSYARKRRDANSVVDALADYSQIYKRKNIKQF